MSTFQHNDREVTIDIDEVVRETPRAKCFDIGEDEDLWVPKSIILDEDHGWVLVPEWFAIERGIV